MKNTIKASLTHKIYAEKKCIVTVMYDMHNDLFGLELIVGSVFMSDPDTKVFLNTDGIKHLSEVIKTLKL